VDASGADLGWVSLPTEEFERLAKGRVDCEKQNAELRAENERLLRRIERLTRALSHS